MSRTFKLLIVVLCFSLCGAGSFIVSTPRDEQSPQKLNAVPVKNREIVRPVWIVAEFDLQDFVAQALRLPT